jgi:hypothetical protein
MAQSPEHKDVSSLFGASDKTAIDFGEVGVYVVSQECKLDFVNENL